MREYPNQIAHVLRSDADAVLRDTCLTLAGPIQTTRAGSAKLFILRIVLASSASIPRQGSRPVVGVASPGSAELDQLHSAFFFCATAHSAGLGSL